MTISKNTGYLVKPTNPRINSATPTDLIFSTAQDILITRGYQINSNPLGLTPLLMSVSPQHAHGRDVGRGRDVSLLRQSSFFVYTLRRRRD